MKSKLSLWLAAAVLTVALMLFGHVGDAAKLYNMCGETTATTGTGTVTLGGAIPSYQTFANCGVQNGDVVTYIIVEGNNREQGRGTYTSAGTTLSRDTVLQSTEAADAKISLAGAAKVYVGVAAEDIPLDNINNLTEDTAPDQANDFSATYDASASGNKKVKLNKFGAGIQSVWIPAGGWAPETTNGCAQASADIGNVQLATCDFAGSTANEAAQVAIAFPKSADETVDLTADVYYNSTGTGTVKWDMSCSAQGDGDATNITFPAVDSVTDTIIAANDTMVAAITTLTVSNWTEGDVVFCRLNRDQATDSSVADARLIGVKIKYTINANNDN